MANNIQQNSLAQQNNSPAKQSRDRDEDMHKGATEAEAGERSQNSMSGQLSHRESDPLLKQSDSDFPEPGSNPEHSGQKEVNPEAIGQSDVDQSDDPGFAQKTNQNWRKDDPLAA